MKIAVLSDIHSNVFALKAVLADVSDYGINKLVVLGDIFGYYPWANETFRMLNPFLEQSVFIKGNHDQLLLDEFPSEPLLSYWTLARHNRETLLEKNPEAINWLSALPFNLSLEMEGKKIHLFHGTPSNKSDGRHYPDTEIDIMEFGGLNDIVLLGHTHYPCFKTFNNPPIYIFNPGSVGQPRDGNPMPSWGIIDLHKMEFKMMRSEYDYLQAAEELTRMRWDDHEIAEIKKLQKGKLS